MTDSEWNEASDKIEALYTRAFSLAVVLSAEDFLNQGARL